MARLTVLEQIAGAHRVLPLNPARVALLPRRDFELMPWQSVLLAARG